jgi:hypothetical protein
LWYVAGYAKESKELGHQMFFVLMIIFSCPKNGMSKIREVLKIEEKNMLQLSRQSKVAEVWGFKQKLAFCFSWQLEIQPFDKVKWNETGIKGKKCMHFFTINIFRQKFFRVHWRFVGETIPATLKVKNFHVFLQNIPKNYVSFSNSKRIYWIFLDLRAIKHSSTLY